MAHAMPIISLQRKVMPQPNVLPKDMHVWITFKHERMIEMLTTLRKRGDADLISVSRTLGTMHGYILTYQCDEEVSPPLEQWQTSH